MALHILKETKTTIGSIHRLPSPPASPSRRTTSGTSSGTAFKSKILAALDAELDALQLDYVAKDPSGPAEITTQKKPKALVLKPLQSTNSSTSLPIHPFFLKDRTTPVMSVISEEVQPIKGKAQSRKKTKEPATAPKSSATVDLTTMNGSAQTSQTSSTNVSLPLFAYRDYVPMPTVVYTENEDEANDLVHSLKGPVGFDMEWRVLLRRGQSPSDRRTALIQLSDSRMILLIQISSMKKFPQKVKEIIESPDIVKMGANIRGDGTKLFNDFGIIANNLVELGGLAQQADPTFKDTYNRSIVSLAKMIERYLHNSIDKGSVRLSDWESLPLSEAQKRYAANDAYSALMVYTCLVNMAQENNIALLPGPYTSNLKEDYVSGRLVSPNPTIPAVPLGNINTNNFTKPRYVVNNKEVTHWHSKTQSRLGDKVTYQQMRAYKLWQEEQASLDYIRATLRSPENPLAESTVITYVVRAIQANPALPFDMNRLKEFVQLEAGSWARHKDWLVEMDALLAAA
ncbi:hypothetical protein QCA50_013441 [Cerrena zonata]|uniref:3'-5' exonuclease domain-containing protein n=1 Tax=Cerrena zonata TaxID=2478898 RepID=A0AAW0FPH9_9APHY